MINDERRVFCLAFLCFALLHLFFGAHARALLLSDGTGTDKDSAKFQKGRREATCPSAFF